MVVFVYVVLWPYQVWVQMEMGSLLSQAVSRLLHPQGFRLFIRSSRSGPTCVICPLHTPELLATSVHHLYMIHCDRELFKTETERRIGISGFLHSEIVSLQVHFHASIH